jgi:phosphomannomutase
VTKAGGRAVLARTGHAFLKQALRDTGAVYGGEMSAHRYFRDYMCYDSGKICWLLVAELVGRSGKSLSSLLSDRMDAFPSPGEINFHLDDPAAAIACVEAALADLTLAREELDGLSLAFADWRLNLRLSNTEPLQRLNVEARGPEGRLDDRLTQVMDVIEGLYMRN